jgi:hypothetical protein
MKTHQQTLTAIVAGIALTGTLALTGTVQAQPSGHYFPGIEGLKGATLPPPGIYLRDYNLVYFADRLNDTHGNQVNGIDPNLFIYANVPRLIWITDLKLLGGYIGVDALLPIQYTDLEVPGLDDNTFGLGDLFGEATWSTHAKQFDASLGFGVFAPTGNSSPTNPTEPGLGYWTYMFTAGATVYFDEGKKWALSALNRYEITSEKDNTDFTAGDTWTLEYGLSYAVTPTLDVGLAGYYQRQVTVDENGLNYGLASATALGPEVSVFYPRITFGWSLRYLIEVGAEDRFQGQTVAFTLTKRF